MPYTHITRTAFGADALQYIRGDGKGHNGADLRNEYITGINMLPDSVMPFEEQMKPYWDDADVRHTTQIDRYILSFSRKELNPEDPADIAKAHHIACRFAEIIAPEHQAMVATQTDGKGGLIHCHIALNDVNMVTKKGLPKGQYAHFNVRKIADKLCSDYFDLDAPDLADEKESRTVRAKKAKNAKIEKKNAEEVKRAQAEGRQPVLQQTEYIWIEDLKSRIREAAQAAASEDEFFAECRARGVEVEHRHETKKQPVHYCYELTDVSGFGSGKIPPNLKKKSYKLGANYQPEGVAAMFKQTELQAAPEPVPEPAGQHLSREDRAKDDAMTVARKMYVDYRGWGYTSDYKEQNRRRQEVMQSWQDFEKWRDERQTPDIYTTDTFGYIFVNYDELQKQYKEFLTPAEDLPAAPEVPDQEPEAVIPEVPAAPEPIPEKRDTSDIDAKVKAIMGSQESFDFDITGS